MGLGCDQGGKGRQDDVKAVGVKSADGDCAAIGYGRDIPKILLKGQGFPLEGMLNGFCINASGIQADTCTNAAGVSHPSFECRFIINGIDLLVSGSLEGCGDVLGLGKSNGASVEAVGSEESKWVGWREIESEPVLDDMCEGGDSA